MDANNPQSLNRYNYVGNMPVTLTDPSGLVPIGCGFGVSGGGDAALTIGFGVGTGGIIPAVAGAVGCAIGLIDLGIDLFHHPQFNQSTTPRPGAIWDEHGSYKPTASIAGILGIDNAGCEFGACGSSFGSVPGCPACEDKDTTISDVIDIGVAWDAVWGGISGVAKYAGCGVVGAGKGAQSFFCLFPPTVNNGPPGPISVLRAGRGAYKIGAAGMMYRLGKMGPLGRAAGDLVPGLGELLLYGQGTLAVSDGARAAYDCGSKVK